MSAMQGKTITVSADMHVPFAAPVIWPLLCPVREYDWIPTWDCRVIHSESGVNELGCVFQTDFPTECGRETWVTNRFEPCERLEFVRTNEARTIRFVITLSPDGEGTNLNWTQHVTPLNEAGVEYCESKSEVFAMQMDMVRQMLAHYLETGTMLTDGDIGLLERIKSHVHDRATG